MVHVFKKKRKIKAEYGRVEASGFGQIRIGYFQEPLADLVKFFGFAAQGQLDSSGYPTNMDNNPESRL